jgi:hypothetical protein
LTPSINQKLKQTKKRTEKALYVCLLRAPIIENLAAASAHYGVFPRCQRKERQPVRLVDLHAAFLALHNCGVCVELRHTTTRVSNLIAIVHVVLLSPLSLKEEGITKC